MQDSKSKTLGTFIKDKRIEKGMSGRELARRAGVDTAYVVRIERGEFRSPRPDTLKNIASALNMPITDLFALADYLIPGELPHFAPYLRAKYAELPVEAIESITEYFSRVAAEHGVTVAGPANGEDEVPWTRAEDIDPEDLR